MAPGRRGFFAEIGHLQCGNFVTTITNRSGRSVDHTNAVVVDAENAISGRYPEEGVLVGQEVP
jgi:hypothetical protein